MDKLNNGSINKEAFALGLVLKNLDNFDMSTFQGRLILQKSVYLMQAHGIYIGYDFSWYLRGPYSSHLANIGFQLEENYDNIPKGMFEKSVQKKFQVFLKFMEDKKNNPDRLEILASIHFLKKIYPNMLKTKIIKTVKNKQKYFTKKECENAWNELEGRNLI